MDTSDFRFKGMHSIIDAHFRELQNDGVGASVKHAGLIEKDEENLLWERGVLGDDTPERLLRAVFYYNGKIFACEVKKNTVVSKFHSLFDPLTLICVYIH